MTLLLFLALAACGEQRPPAPTAKQNDQLNEAEAMLNEEGPEAQAPDPSDSHESLNGQSSAE